MLAGLISCREVWLDANVHISFCLFAGRCPHHRLLSHLVIPLTQISACIGRQSPKLSKIPCENDGEVEIKRERNDRKG